MRAILSSILIFFSSAVYAQLSPSEVGLLLDLYKGQLGPHTLNISGKGELELDSRYLSIDSATAGDFFEDSGMLRPAAGTSIFAPRDFSWYASVQFHDEGFIKDDDDIDPSALLKALRTGNEKLNAERKNKNLELVTITGWSKPPKYNPKTKRLEWGMDYLYGAERTVNYTTRFLGRSGYISASLVTYPDMLEGHIREFNDALSGLAFVKGERYVEFKQGDRVAKYGLAALVTGGAVAVAAKSWKLIFAAIAAGFVAIVAGIKKIFGRKT